MVQDKCMVTMDHS